MSKKSAVIVSDPSWDDPDYAPGMQQDPWVEESEPVVEVDPNSLESQIKVGDRVEGWHPFSQEWKKVEVTRVNRKSFQGIDANFDKWVGMTQWRLPTSNSVLESVDLDLQQKSLESEPPTLSKPESSSNDSLDTISPALNSGTISAPLTLEGDTGTSSQEVHPAKTSAVPESETESQAITLPCSSRCLESLQSHAPVSLSGKTWKDLSIGDLERFLPDSEWSDIASSLRKSYQQRNLERHTSESESLLLPTPVSYSAGSKKGKKSRKAGQTKLDRRLRLLPTPIARQEGKSRSDFGVKLHSTVPLSPDQVLNPLVPFWMMGFRRGCLVSLTPDGGETTPRPVSVESPEEAIPEDTSNLKPSVTLSPLSKGGSPSKGYSISIASSTETENNTTGKTNASSIHHTEEIPATPRNPQSNPILASGGTVDQRASSDQDREEQHTSQTEPAIADSRWVHEDRRGEALSSDGGGKESIQQVRREWIDPQLVIVDAGTQSRVETKLDTVKYYAELMGEGLWNWEQKPLPIVFLAPDGKIYASDAHHRTVAATLAGIDRVLYEVRDGTLDEAICHSCRANSGNGLQPTPKDRRNSIELFLDTRARLPDNDERKAYGSRRIAKYLNLPPKSGYRTVVNILKEQRKRAEKQSGKISTEKQAKPSKEKLHTLEEIWELALQSMDAEQFDLDPYQSGAPAKEVFSPDEGLKQNWNGRTVFLFPPDAQAHEWIENLLEEYDAGNIDEAVVLVRTRPEKPWFHGLLEFPTCLLFNRVEANGSKWNGAATFIGKSDDQFCSVFGEVGTIIKVMGTSS